MTRINSHYQKLKAGYLFPEISRRVQSFAADHPNADLIRLGIGDVVLPLAPRVLQGLHDAADEMGRGGSFRGYGPEQGYDFLRELIVTHDFAARGVDVSADEVFVSDGSKCDTGNIQEIFDPSATVAVGDPVYPVYVDTSVMAGRTGDADERGHFAGIQYLPCTKENGFVPPLPDRPADLIYLCFPNNPTGSVASKAELKKWVDLAREHGSVILFDAAYEAFISDDSIPHSIYEVEGAREVAIEFRSFSKTAGFTGTRCAYAVVPKDLKGEGANGEPVAVHSLWNRRQSTKFNGVSYIVQRGAAQVYSDEGRKQVRANIDYYMANAKTIREGLAAAGLTVHGGTNAPYIWLETPAGMGSWDFFDRLLHDAHVVGTPGSGFGPAGEGYFRLSAFGDRDQVAEAVQRIRKQL